MSDKSSGENKRMEVDVSLTETLPTGGGIDETGVLGDDERTEISPSKLLEEGEDGEKQPGSPGGGGRPRSDSDGRKKKHRRGKHKGGRRHWKPYSKMTWDEKKQLEDRETRRACKKREDRFASGLAMAPYNTTQFLMEQHEPSDGIKMSESSSKGPRLNKSEGGGDPGSGGQSGSCSSPDEYEYSSPDDEEIFLEKEFTEAYENYHAERLQTMTKDELVREYLELESKVETLEKERQNGGKVSPDSGKPKLNGQQTLLSSPDDKLLKSPRKQQKSPEETALADLQEEINKLRQDNENLRSENDELRRTSSSVNQGEP